MTKTHVGFYALSAALMLAIVLLAACEGAGPRNCPPPLGCSK
jgi:hypothetical protein